MKSQPIEINKGERLLLVNLNKSFDQSKAEGVYKRSEHPTLKLRSVIRKVFLFTMQISYKE